MIGKGRMTGIAAAIEEQWQVAVKKNDIVVLE
jgi:hypothetical protein